VLEKDYMFTSHNCLTSVL